MTVSGLNELELLSHEDLIVEALQLILKTYAELTRRKGITRDFLKDLCRFSIEAQIWYIIWESGSSQRFTDILRVVGCSRTTLSDALLKLMRTGLIRMVETRYQAVSPAWLVQKTGPNVRKP